METGGKCCVCGGGHRASRCPDLCDPLNEGFFKGGGGGGGCDDHDHDHDERLKLERVMNMGMGQVRWITYEDSHRLKSYEDSLSLLRLNAQYSLHVGSYAAPHQFAVRCRA